MELVDFQRRALIYLHLLLYTLLTSCLLIGYEPTVNFGNRRNLQISQ